MRNSADRFSALLIRLIVICACCLSSSAHAARWLDLGQGDVSLDKQYFDLATVVLDGDLRVVQVMTVYDKSRANAHGVWMDRHVQRLAFDCTRRAFSAISTAGFLDGKRVGVTPAHVDWKDDFKPIPGSATSQRIFALACNSPVTGIANAPAESAGAPVIPVEPATPATPPLPGAMPAFRGSKSGTGIVINRGGEILTNNHVISGCTTLSIRGNAGTTVAAAIEAADPQNDLALIKAASELPHAASFREQAKPARLGEQIGVIGFPLAGQLSMEPKATFGQINSVAGMHDDYRLLQFSAPIQPGNSGGPLLDATGAVIGVVVSTITTSGRTGPVPQNVNFAIRGELAQIFLNAHGAKYNIAKTAKKLETDEIAEAAQQFTVMIRCN